MPKDPKNKVSILTKREKGFLIALLLFTVIAPYLFTRDWGFFHFDPVSGAIGDSIGGITAPFIGLIAAYLVYKSFEAQIIANKQLREDHDKQMNLIISEQSVNFLLNFYKEIENDYYVQVNDEHNADTLIYSLRQFDKLRTEKFNPISKSQVEVIANQKLEISLRPVAYIYHSFILFLKAAIEIIERTEDTNTKTMIKYTGTKIENLFSQNSYSLIIDGVIDETYRPLIFNKSSFKELVLVQKAALNIKSMIMKLDRLSEL